MMTLCRPISFSQSENGVRAKAFNKTCNYPVAKGTANDYHNLTETIIRKKKSKVEIPLKAEVMPLKLLGHY